MSAGTPCTLVDQGADDDGHCVASSAPYGNNERCTFTALADVVITAQTFSTESCCDRITIGATSFAGTAGPSAVSLEEGATMAWCARWLMASDAEGVGQQRPRRMSTRG